MKRKKIGLLIGCITAIAIFVMVGCGSSSESSSESLTMDEVQEEEKKVPLSLIGNWEPAELGDSYQAGYISEERIEIFWVSDGGDIVALYWSGTYDAPMEATDSYSWDSINDTSITDYAILAATAESKTFTYENGVLTYEVAALGTTTTYSLIMTDTDYTVYASDVSDESEITDTADTDELQSETSVLVYADENIEVLYDGCNSIGLEFTVINYTDSVLHLAFSSLALDYISYDIMNSDCYNSITVSPDSTGKGTQVIPDEFSSDIHMISGGFSYSLDETDDVSGSFCNVFVVDDVNISMNTFGKCKDKGHKTNFSLHS